MPFMSIRLLHAWKMQWTIIHTALDDLESFLWVLIWGIVYASKDIKGAMANYPGIKLMLKVWKANNGSKLAVADEFWANSDWNPVFGDLIQEWMKTFQQARKVNHQLTKKMSTTHLGSQEWDEICNRLESYCEDIYREVLKSGFRHLGGVREYSDWNTVVASYNNVSRQW